MLAETPFELGRINYGRCNERPYRYAWGVAASPGNWIDEIVKVDVADRSHIGWKEPAAFPGEPVFVAEPGAEAEDAGVVLSVVLDSERGTSYLLVLDAADLSEIARATVPHHIPFNFHGIFSSSV